VGRLTLSVAIIARDEARHIAAAIQSVAGLADEVVVVLDSRTSDATGQIASDLGARVILEPWRNFSAQRNLALDYCAGDWVLFLDADERLTPALYQEIQNLLHTSQDDAQRDLTPDTSYNPEERRSFPIKKAGVGCAGYWIPRHNLFFGKVVRGGGWYPDHQLRLVQRGRTRYDETRLVHELAQIDGDLGYLHGHLLHLNIERFAELWAKQQHYALQEAEILRRSGRKARLRNLLGGPVREFVRRFIVLGGWRDGALGLLLCGTLAYFEGVKFMHMLKHK
jgi:glycosyltransferase involved in cell wall biosynthesis